MDWKTQQRTFWELVASQHGVVSREQLVSLGFTPRAIDHRIARDRLRRVRRGVYVVGRPELSLEGQWMAAVLSCGPGAALSHESAAALWGIRNQERAIEVSITRQSDLRRPGIVIHRRSTPPTGAIVRFRRIPLTQPALTLVDLAARITQREVEAAVNEADKLDLIDPESLRLALPSLEGVPGVAVVRRVLDRKTFTLTDSELERRFLAVVRQAGLPAPRTRQWISGFRVDFFWPELGLVVETDGLRYHRTPTQQAKDRRRDQAHAAEGLCSLRFTHAQVASEPRHVEHILQVVAARLAA